VNGHAQTTVSPPASAIPSRYRVRAELFAAGRDDPRGRRPSDAIRAVAYLLLLLVAAVLSVVGHDFDTRLSNALVDLPAFLHALWLLGVWGAVGWAAALLVIMLVRGRPLLTAEALVASILAIGGSACVAALVGESPGDVFSRAGDVNGPPVFPPAVLAMTSAVLATLAPRLTVPFRRVGRWLILVQLLGALCLGATLASGAVAAIALGLLAGTTLHLAFGSPGGFPTVGRVRSALEDLGIDVDGLHPVSMGPEGWALLAGRDSVGPVQVKVYGRDAWDGELVASAWRRVWYRDTQWTARLGRVEYVEHEGLVTFLAQRAGARVPHVITAGLGDNGDALIAVRPDGTPLLDGTTALDADQLATLWDQLAILHASGIAHRRIDLDRVVKHADHTAGFSDLASATVQSRPVDKLEDQAQLIALGVLSSGEDLAAARARAALGDSGLVAVLPYLQEAVLPPHVRTGLRRRKIALDDVRKRLSSQLDVSEIELTHVRRVTWKSLLSLLLLIVATYTLIGMLANIDLGSFVRALGDANWWWLGAALLIGQLPRITNAVSTIGSTTQPLPLGPTALMQFASCYVNLAVPSSAGRLALTTRFFQRFGVSPATALSAGVIDSVSEFVTQVALFLLVFFVSDVDLGLSVSQDQLSGLATTALIIFGVLVVAGAVAFLVPSLRTKARTSLLQARDALQVLRSPSKLLQLYGGNLLSQLLFALTLGACVRAFGMHLPLSDLILINTVVSLFAGLLPVPGGVGVTEGGISLGLTRAGVPAELAFAIALSYRFAVFYLPPIWGYVCFRWLAARRYL
jgi:glycosyltransferase 2 family protein